MWEISDQFYCRSFLVSDLRQEWTDSNLNAQSEDRDSFAQYDVTAAPSVEAYRAREY